MLTRCPACDTRFRVTAEQIKARHGRVRCGACQHAFNALDELIEEPVLVMTAPAAAPAGDATTGIRPERAVSPAPTLADEAAPLPAAADVAGLSFPSAPKPDDAAGEAEVPAATPEAPAMPSEPMPEAPVEATGEPAPAAADGQPQELPEPGTGEGEAPEPEPQDPDEAVAEAPPRRWPWITGSLFAVLVLGLQAALAFRVEMAVLWPEAKPALVALCDLAGCEVGLPTKVALVGIEASDLHPDAETRGRLILTATLKNRAPFAQQFPHLELTLTDTADKPVARKVLAPADYLPPRSPIADGMPPSADISVTLGVDSGEMAASGYRLYLFYP